MPDLTDPASLAYLAYLEGESKPPNTVARKRAVLTSVGNAGIATREDVEAWWVTRRHLSEATRSNDLSCLRSFIRWAQIWEHRPDDPTLRLEAPRVGNGVPKPFGKADVRRILDHVTPDLRRAVALGALAGLRVSEAATLDWADVEYETRRIRVVRSKGGKTRLVGLAPQLLDELLPDTGGNVVCAGGKPYTAAVLQRRVNRAIRAAGVDGTFHQLRARFATQALAGTSDLLGVSRALGHNSLNTTSRYTQTSDESLDLIAAAVSL